MINAWWESLRFTLPPADFGAEQWRRWIDTSLASPQDIVPWEQALAIDQHSCTVAPRSVVVLIAGHQALTTQAPPQSG